MFTKFGAKITFGFGFVLLLMVFVATIATISLRQEYNNEERLLHLHHRHQNISKIKYYLVMESSSGRAYLLYKEDRYYKQYQHYHNQMDMELNALLAGTADPVERQLIIKFKELASQYDTIIEEQIKPLGDSGLYEKAGDVARNQAIPVFTRAYELIDELDKKGFEEFKKAVTSTQQFAEIAVVLVPALSALSVLIGALFAILLAGRVTAPVRQLLQGANAVAGGNLDVQVNIRGRDEIATLGETFNNMVCSLRQQRDELTAQNEEIQAQEEELMATLEQLKHDRSKLAALNDFNESLNLSIRLPDLCDNIVGACMREVEAEACALVVVEQDSGKIKNVAAAGLSGIFGEKGELTELTGLAGRCFKEKATLDVSYPKTALTSTVLLNTPCHTAHEVYVPVVFQGKALGVLVAARLDGGPFAQEDIELLKDMMKQGAIALKNALEHLQVEKMYEQVLDQAASVEELNLQLETEKENLKRAQEITQSVIDSLDEAVVMLGLDGRVAAANRRWEDFFGEEASSLYGLSAEELYQKTISNLENSGQVFADLAEATAGEMSRGETEAIQKNRVLKIWTGPVLGKDDKVLGRLFVYRDITREAGIDRMKSEFVSTVSHELRTPLSSILGFSELLLIKEFNDDTRKKYISTIHKEARRLTNLVNDFLDLQRMESGHQTYRMEEIAAGELINEVVESFSARGHNHKLKIDASVDLRVHADRERITQVLLNLLSNAVKFSPDSAEITVGLERDGDFAMFSVKDRGLGIPEDVQANLFTKFYRVDNSDRRKIGGTGLGLAICKEIVTAHGGRIWVQSVHGQGSTFYFTLKLSDRGKQPFAKSERPASGSLPKGRDPELSSSPAAADRSKQVVLLVEDDASLAALFKGHLDEAGYQVEINTSGEGALASVKAVGPAAIVLDILLAGKLSGWDVLSRLKGDPDTAAIPVIISSCLAEKEMGMAMGASEYLVNPFPPQRLVEVVDKLASHEGSKRPNMATPGHPRAREWILNKLREKGLTILDIIDERDVIFVVVESAEPPKKPEGVNDDQ